MSTQPRECLENESINKLKHDINNLIQITLGLLERAAIQMPANAKGKDSLMKAIEYLETQGKNLTFMEPSSEIIDINRLVEKHASMLQAVKPFLNLSVSLDKRLRPFEDHRGDLIERAVQNMLLNAYESAESNLKISTGLFLSPFRMKKPYIAVIVENDGFEMQEKTLERIAVGRHSTKGDDRGFGIPVIKEAGLEFEDLHIFSNPDRTAFYLILKPARS